MPTPPPPDVSVVIAAYNAMPYLNACLDSVLGQTLGADRIEVIAVDDGSTDGTGEELDRRAALHPNLQVRHQPNSGGPGAPRNAGLDTASGRYVFFLDADDWLGEEALERMVAMADEHGSDVLLGKMVGIGGRGVPGSMFRSDQPRADLFTSRVYWTLSPTKLFRRSHVERLGLRFRTDMSTGEDQPFTALAYLRAAVISVLASYPCYYAVKRDDGGNTTLLAGGAAKRLPMMRTMLPLVAENVPAGPRRDHLMVRHMQIELGHFLSHLSREGDPDFTKRIFAEVREWVQDYCTPAVEAELSPAQRLRVHLIRRDLMAETLRSIKEERSGATGKEVVEDGRVYGGFPFFRDAALAIPDALYDITDTLGAEHRLDAVQWVDDRLRLRGYAYLHRVDTVDVDTELVLRDRAADAEVRAPVTVVASPELTAEKGKGRYDYGEAGFEVLIDPARMNGGAPLDEGQWDFHLAVRAQGVEKLVRLGTRRAKDMIGPPRRHTLTGGDGAAVVVAPYFASAKSGLSLDVGGRTHALAASLRMTRAGWADGGAPDLELAGRLDLGDQTVRRATVRISGENGAVYTVPAECAAAGRTAEFVARVPLRRCADGGPLAFGTWELTLVLDLGGSEAVLALPLADPVPGRRWWRRGRPVYARAPRDRGRLRVVLAPIDVMGALRRRLGR